VDVTKRALVTGAAGFIGRHFTTYMRDSLDWVVDTMDIAPTPHASRFDANDFFRVDTGEVQYDLVVHAAYHVGGRVAIDGNPSVLALNLALDANMFNWAVRTGQLHVLYFSSSAVYPVELQTGKLRNGRNFFSLAEEHACIDLPLLPDARYGWAKLTGEKLAQAAREQGLKVTVVRPFSGYGWDQSDDYPFPTFVRRALRREDPFVIWGSEHQSRDWIHIDDVVRGALEIASNTRGQHPLNGITSNLGSGQRTTMLQLANMVCDAVGYSPTIEVLRDKPLGVMERVADTSLMNLYYTPQVTLLEGIREAIKKLGDEDK
jgi:nucleoside-diphosphate-sugar epimerase